jgi:hypothetical protein
MTGMLGGMSKNKADVSLVGSLWYHKSGGRVLHLFSPTTYYLPSLPQSQQHWKSLCGKQEMWKKYPISAEDYRDEYPKCKYCDEILIYSKNPKVIDRITGDDWDAWWDAD